VAEGELTSLYTKLYTEIVPSLVRISPKAHSHLAAIAKATNSSLQDTLDRAVENERRRLLLETANAAYAKLRASDSGWESYRTELRDLDSTVADGL
jgi:hypothetical protein